MGSRLQKNTRRNKKKSEDGKKDRLDIVRAVRFSLFALQRSVAGWIEWVNNPDVMATFSLEELGDINKTLSELTRPFIEYDAKIAGHSQRSLTAPESNEDSEEGLIKRSETKKDVFYVR